ncbi:MAG: D-Ala-D-Ala carboxypeptidase family metallohydrolase [bacterium]|jgi:hypothetical protein
MTDRLSPNFTRAEFERSATAARLGMNNAIPDALLPNARRTAAVLESIRAHLSALAGVTVPITVTSGYRSELVNRAVGSSDTSAHRLALAADFIVPAFGTPTEICRALAVDGLLDRFGIEQLIDEYPDSAGGWVHVGLTRPANPRNRIITITRRGTSAGIVAA